MQVFSDRLRLIREKRGLSQRELARRCELSINQISRYENSVIEPSLSALQAIIRELAVSADYLLGFIDEIQDTPAPNALGTIEDELLKTYRREGWAGVARVSVEKLSER